MSASTISMNVVNAIQYINLLKLELYTKSHAHLYTCVVYTYVWVYITQ